MYKKALISVGGGMFCQATANDEGLTIITRENGRMIRRQMTASGTKAFGGRAVSYADAYFEFPFATVEVMGEEVMYAVKTSSGA